MEMSQTVVLELPEATYEAVRSQAAARGMKPEEVIVEWLSEAFPPRAARGGPARPEPAQVTEDPLEALIGSLESETTDIAERHDHYIGQALVDRPQGG